MARLNIEPCEEDDSLFYMIKLIVGLKDGVLIIDS